ncbi:MULTISPECIES: hypothetical protein [Aerococcus]|uniref:hypothetical protein n=1 Tax=Aerococcus TaxID=1375 RepID=UPI000DCC42E8|nr:MULTISPECIES: hypothetical protein [Aerococcus]KAA9299820.1 hypothetical protein F6I08_00160 [Aerococcus tenax]MDK8133232.1 hypothetical protein [Aerococcus urinae]MDK8485359.1 hypothetical protein [Aerococcus urinae]MDL5178296.1 hypothetical protein [Aerococcus tenax]MDL5207311.1 hypothetical protein [Aerococcus tenax]
MDTTKDNLIKNISEQKEIILNNLQALGDPKTDSNIKAVRQAANSITADLIKLKMTIVKEPAPSSCLTAEHLSKVANALNSTLSTIQKQETIDKVIRMASYTSGVNAEYFQELEKAQHDLDNDFQNQIKCQGDTLEAIYCLLCNSDDEAEVKNNLEALGIDY